MLNEIAILALFALSLDLILGYAGIVSLGHAAFFGVGAYAAGLLAKTRHARSARRPRSSPSAAPTVLGFVTSFLVLRGSDLTRLMVTLRRRAGAARGRQRAAAMRPAAPTACRAWRSAPLLGRFDFDLCGRTAYAYSLTTLFVLFLLARRIVQLALRPVADGHPPQSRCARAALGVPVNRRLIADLHAGGRLRRRGRRLAGPDHGLRLAGGAASSTARPTCCWC